MYTSNDPSLGNTNDNVLNNSHLARSAVSWGAIFAGATAAAALSLILLMLGTGLGMSSVSPWAQDGISATTFGISTIVWITFMSVAASALGGYLAGRLRTKWVGVHTDEVFFRDTAHGLLAWAVATFATAALLTSIVGAIVGGGIKAGASVASGVTSTVTNVASSAVSNVTDGEGNNTEGVMNYFVDSLFRGNAQQNSSSPASADPTQPGESPTAQQQGQSAPRSDANSSAEVGRIFINSIWREDDLPEDDMQYVAQLIAERTDLTQQQAEQRVTDTYARLQTRLAEMEEGAKEAADAALEASAYASLWFFISLLAGAFVSALAATWGGRQRDL